MACATPPEDASSDPADSTSDARGENATPQEQHRLYRIDPKLAPGLYVVSTPIGNLRDITLRALDILASADLVLAEDTRVSSKLLAAFGVSARLRPYHDHNAAQLRPQLLNDLQAGARIALISDAGTPLVSDPGYKLVREAAQQGVSVIAIPGASAPLTALASAGLPTDRFMFVGFPPPKSAARRRFLSEMKDTHATLVFFEGPSRLAESLADMSEILGARDAAVARELTKKFEEIRRASLSDLAAHYEREGPPRGEIVILVGPPSHEEATDEATLDAAILAAGEDRPLKEIAAEIAEKLGLKRRDVYERALDLREDKDKPDEA